MDGRAGGDFGKAGFNYLFFLPIPAKGFGGFFYIYCVCLTLGRRYGQRKLFIIPRRYYPRQPLGTRALDKYDARFEKVQRCVIVTEDGDRVAFGNILRGDGRSLALKVLDDFKLIGELDFDILGFRLDNEACNRGCLDGAEDAAARRLPKLGNFGRKPVFEILNFLIRRACRTGRGKDC